MKQAAMLVLLVLGLSALAYAGKIYGSVTEGGKPVGQNVKVEVTCGGNNYAALGCLTSSRTRALS